MTKSELINQIVESSMSQDLEKLNSKVVIEQSVKVIVDSMTRSLARGQRIEIRGFGSFDLNDRPARVGRNPRTGEKVDIPAKKVPHFKPGKELRERVNEAVQDK
ncbi:integration host factor subunit beta [Neisseriaceae bacterium PsAf]|nr:integration host factor subunit beta [Neisseriaceae bacterium PsAf]MCV2502585.1 integration host factor subunit beta [Neisseriaceae bacterium]